MRQVTCQVLSYLALAAGWWALPNGETRSEEQKKPRVDLTAESLLDPWSAAKAAEYLDVRANADEGAQCLNCHATYAYLPARPWLPAPGTTLAARRKATEQWADGLLKEAWSPEVAGDKPVDRKVERRITEALLTATVLAQHDAITMGRLQPVTRASLDLIWKLQRADGGWHWLKTTEPPSATDDHYGVTMVAIGVGLAPEGYAKTPAAQAGLDKMRAYLQSHPPQHMHQRLMLLWADHCAGGILSSQERQSTIADLIALQRADGGWAMASLAPWKRIDKTPQDLANGDGYGTGLVVYVLRVAGGVPTDAPAIRNAVEWINTHQRQSGYWYTRSPKINDVLSTYAGTAYVVMALHACGEIR
jgi:squalene-hopene/tetraprenyl-beta-curcumene cyclase